MDAAKAAVRHQDDNVARAMLANNGVDDRVDVRDMTSLLTTCFKVVDELHGVEAFRFRQRRSKHRGENHLIGTAECASKVVLEHAPARRG